MICRLSASLLSLLLLLTSATAKEPTSTSVGVAMTEAAQEFLKTLDEASRSRALMSFDDSRRLDWHNIPKPERKGLQVRDMGDKQRAACHQLLKSALSETGYEKAVRIMALENNLREGEKNLKGGHLRDPDRYFLTIFGTPDRSGTWGWSFEGHHFSLNFVIHDGHVVGDTPSFWGANPATVKVFVEGGPQVGTRTLADEEQKAFDLVNSLDETQRRRALIAEQAPADYRAAGQPEPPQGAPEGLPASEMTDAQRQTLKSLLAAYCGHLATPLAAVRMSEIESADLGRVHFAWMGSTRPGVGHAYRIQGPTFVLELVNIQPDPQGNPANHIHSVWRSLPRDFGLTTR